MSVTKLSKAFTQFDKLGHDESTLTLTVAYNPQTAGIDKIISVSVYDFHTGRTVDITAIMAEQFGEQIDSMIDSVSWHELYHESKRRLTVHDKGVVVHDSVGIIKSLQSHFIKEGA